MSKNFKVKNGLEVTTNVTASGDISSSGTITMLTASIGGGIFTSASLAVGVGGGGSMDNFTLTADGGSNQTIADGNTLDIAGGDGITTAVGATDTVTVNVDASQDGHISSILTTDLKLGEDAQTKIDFETNNEIHFDVNNAELFNMTGNQLSGSGVSTGSFGRLDATSLPNIGYANFTGSVGIGTTSPGEKLEVVGNISASGEIQTNKIQFPIPTSTTANGIFFKDTSSNAPHTNINVIQWDFSNDDAFIYAHQSSSDGTYLVNELRDNTSTDKFVWWFNNFAGATTDSFPLMLEGNKAVVNYIKDKRVTFHRDSNATNGAANNVDFFLLKSGSTSVSTANSLIHGDVSAGKTTLNDIVFVDGNITASGDISASGTITAEQLTSTDDITAAGTIKSSVSGQAILSLDNTATNGDEWNIISKVRGSTSMLEFRNVDTSTDAVAITSAGKVGIGTTSPAGTLHISSSNDPNLIIEDPNGSGLLRFRRTDEEKNFDISLQGSDLRFTPTDTNGTMNVLVGVNASSVKVDSRLGVGQPSPSEALDVSGSINISGPGHITASGNISASGYISSSGVTISEQGDLRLIGGANDIIFGEPGDTTSQNYGIKTDGNLFLDIDKDNDNTGNFFQFRSNQASTNIMRIKDTGEVGIGTTAPPKTLTVAGEISASGNITTPSTGSVGNLIATTIEGTLSDSSRTDINSILATDLVLGEDAQTKIDFGTANIIKFFANNSEKMTISDTGVVIDGDITAQQYIVNSTVTNVTQSFSSGSTIFGDTPADDTHQFTGSVSVTGSFTANTVDINGGTLDGITSLTAGGDLDIGAHDLRAATLTADGLTNTRVVFAGSNGVLSGNSKFTFASNKLSIPSLNVSQSAGIGISIEQPTTALVTARFDSDRFRFWAGGSERLTILSASGHVGIGDSAPNQLLGILGTNAQISIEESNTEFLRLGVGETEGDAVIGWDDSTFLRLGVYSSPTDTSIVTGVSVGPTGHITASGDISASGTMTMLTGSAGNLIATTLEGTLADSSRTDINSILATDLVLGEDAQTKIDFETANEIHFDINNSELFNMTGNELSGSDSSTGSFASLNVRGSVQDNLTVDGTLFATKKSFLIPRPEGGKLEYGVLEGQQNDVFFRGELKGDNVIYLPKEWEWLVDENTITVQLTSIGNFQELFVKEIKDNKIFIHVNGAFKTKKDIHCYHIIHGTRKDVELIRNYQ